MINSIIREKHQRIRIVYIIMCSILCGCMSNDSLIEPTETLQSYFQIRYSEVNSENFWERNELMQEYYTEAFIQQDGWMINESNLTDTYESINAYDMTTYLEAFSVIDNKGDTYTISAYVLYETADGMYSHYRDYTMDITMSDGKIDNVEVVKNAIIDIGTETYELHTHEH